MNKRIIIIGAGLAGLSAGCYGQMNGFDTRIFEANESPGGLCTSWQRGDYLFESCIYWLFGTSKGNSLNTLWKELGVASPDRFIGHDEFIRLEWPDGRVFHVFSDLDKLSDEMKRYAPEDTALIDRIRNEAKRMSSFNVYIDKPRECFNWMDVLKLFRSLGPNIGTILKYKNMPVEDFASQFKSQYMRDVMEGLMGFLPNYPALYLIMIFGHMHIGNADFPRGGSRGLAQSVEAKYKDLGGEIQFLSPVERILTQAGRAVGVTLKDGSEFYSDYVISAADGYTTIFKMLDGKYLSKKIREHYEKLPLFHSYMQISFGAACDLSSEPAFLVLMLKEPLIVGNTVVRDIRIRHYCFDDAFAPKGKTSLVVTFACEYDYWNGLHGDAECYEKEKERIRESILSAVAGRFPQIADCIEVSDVATPKTFERRTGNRKGAAEGWYVNHKTVDTVLERSLPGLSNFYMAGHWVEISGGLPFAAISGRDAIHRICIKEKRKLVTK